MEVVVKQLNTGTSETFRGEPAQIARQLVIRWPWAARGIRAVDHDANNLQHVVKRIGSAQNFYVEISS